MSQRVSQREEARRRLAAIATRVREIQVARVALEDDLHDDLEEAGDEYEALGEELVQLTEDRAILLRYLEVVGEPYGAPL